LARCGGDEFMALLPQTARPGAEHVANRILEAIAALGISHEDCPPSHRLSVSVGVACYDERSVCWVQRPEEHRLHDDLYAYSAASDLVLAADEALRAAKRAGRARASVLDIAELDGGDAERASTFALASHGLGGQ
jgi:GGDEF domain-containing protein